MPLPPLHCRNLWTLTNVITTVDSSELSHLPSLTTCSFADFACHFDESATADIAVWVQCNFDVAKIGSFEEKSVASDLLNSADQSDCLAGVLGEHGGVDHGCGLVHFEDAEVGKSERIRWKRDERWKR